MSQENVDVVLAVGEANARGDLDAVYAAYSPDILWEDASGLWGDWGSARGHDGLREAWRRWFKVMGDVTWELEGEPLDAGDEVVATYRVHGRGRRSGAQIDQRLTLVWLVRDGKVARVRAYRERAEGLEAAGVRE